MHCSPTKGKTIHSEAREIKKNCVNRLCKQETVEKNLILPISRTGDRIANYCGVFGATVGLRQIRGETLCASRTRKGLANMNEISFLIILICVIKRTVVDFYVEKKVVPTCKKLLPVIREEINFSWEEQSLRRVEYPKKLDLSGENAKARESF
jgi:hypothetical protein